MLNPILDPSGIRWALQSIAAIRAEYVCLTVECGLPVCHNTEVQQAPLFNEDRLSLQFCSRKTKKEKLQ